MLRRESCRGGKRIVVAAAVLAGLLASSASAGPADVSGLVLWLDADPGRVTKATDNRVSAWSDVTDPANNKTPENVAQSDPIRRPLWVEKAIGGQPAIEFDSGDFLNHTAGNLVAAGSARTVFVVGRLDDRSTGASVLAFRRSDIAASPFFGVNLYAAGDPPALFLVYTDGSNGNRNTPISEPSIALEAIRQPFISTHRSAGSDRTIAAELNGMPLEISSEAAVGTEGGLDGFTVGGSENYPDKGWHGLIAEILVYDRDLKADERKQVGLHLAEKYGISDYGVAILPRLHVAVPEARRPDALATAVTLENDLIGAKFDSETGSLIQLTNKLTDQTLDVWGDQFRIEASRFTLAQKDASQVSLVKTSDEQLEATYQADGHKVVATWQLGKGHHFLQKQLAVSSSSPFGFRNLVISGPGFSGVPLEFVPYRHLRSVSYFGRCPQGGIFVGVELAFDHSSLDARNMVSLGYTPNLKVEADEEILSEPVYLGVYRKHEEEEEAKAGLPLACESDAMVRMISTILGPPRPRFAPAANGWHSEMNRPDYRTEAEVDADLKSVDAMLECGIDWLQESHPWCGDADRVGALVGDDPFQFDSLSMRFIREARRKGMNVVLWGTMNHSNPFVRPIPGPLRPDKPEWLITPIIVEMNAEQKAEEKERTGRWSDGNCLANEPFFRWVEAINLAAMGAAPFAGWAMDGDWFTWDWNAPNIAEGLQPAVCESSSHDHLPGDANYACQRALTELARSVRKRFPDAYLNYCRPPMDLGVWALRHVDATFTIDEFAKASPLEGLQGQPRNVAYGDKIRRWSRVRVHRHFIPHWLDQPQLFPLPKGIGGPDWESEGLDYILLSAISSSPNLLFYFPTKTGVPEKDKRTIRKWLDWGRANTEYIMVRKDLPDWPSAGKVDGSAHICGDRGFVFLFNPNKNPLYGEFVLAEKSIGLKQKGTFRVSQDYPGLDQSVLVRYGETVRWEVPGETPVILKLEPVAQ
ncbi:MAG: hypothetical protein ABIK89_14545 [Planctomycetota bacterium]